MMTKLQNPIFAAGFSLVISIFLGVSIIWKTAAPMIVAAAAAAADSPHAKKKAPPAEKAKGWDFWTIEIENLSTELKGERDRVKKQAEILDQRAARLASEEKELAKVRTEIDGMRKEIASRVVEIANDETKNIRALAQTYSTLTPTAVVAILREMDDTTAVKILTLMKSDAVGPIFEEMSHTTSKDGTLAKRVAVLSEKWRQMKSSTKPAN